MFNVTGNADARIANITSNVSSGPGAYTVVGATNDTGRTVYMEQLGSSYSGTFASIPLANWSYVGASNSSSGLMIDSGGTGPMVFVSSGIEKMRIIQGGNVGIGTTIPLAQLHSRTTGGGVLAVFDDSGRDRRLDIVSDAAGGDSYIGLNAHEFLTTANPMNFVIQTGGTERIRVATDGKVGVGTTAPTEKLHLLGAGPAIRVEDTGTTGNTLLLQANGVTGPTITGHTDSAGNSTYNGQAEQIKIGNGGFVVSTSPATTIGAVRTFTGRFIVDPSGNVGIGTASPAYRLDVVGSIRSSGDLLLSKGAGSVAYNYFDDQFSLAKSGVGERLRIDSNGNIGIGTTSPSAPLEVKGVGSVSNDTTSNAQLWLTNTNTGGHKYSLFSTGSADSSGAGNFGLYDMTVGSYRMIVNKDGNVGIGTTTPSYKLDIMGTARFLNSYSGDTAAYELSGGGGTYAFHEIEVNGSLDDGNVPYYSLHRGNSTAWQLGLLGTTFVIANGGGGATSDLFPTRPLAITTSGNVGIGTTVPSTKLHVRGGGILAESSGTGGTPVYAKNTDTGGKSWAFLSTGSTSSGGAGNLTFFNETDGISPVLITSSGNVGIGITNPEKIVDVAIPSGGNSIRLTSSTVSTDFGINAANTFGFVYTRTASPLVFGTNDTERMTIDSSGNVGIGTASPEVKLDVVGSLGVHGRVTDSASDIADEVLPAQGAFIGWNETNGQGMTHFMNHQGLGNGGFEWSLFDSNGVYKSSPLLIEGSGNVGIGTATPAAKLHISGSEATSGGNSAAIALTNSAAGGASWVLRAGAIGTNTPAGGFSIADETGYRFVIDSAGNVGIGTTAPAAQLHINSNNYGAIILGGNGGTTNHQLVQDGDGAFRIYNGTFGAGNAQVTVSSTGNVGIGTASPAFKLDTVGNMRSVINNSATSAGSTEGGLVIKNLSSTTNALAGFAIAGNNTDNYQVGINAVNLTTGGAAADMQFLTRNTSGAYAEKMRITAGGNVGIGTTAPDSILQISKDAVRPGPTDDGIHQLNITGKTNPNQHIFLGYDTASDYGYIGAAIQGATWKPLILNPGGANVGIGTTAPAQALDVAGTIVTRGANAAVSLNDRTTSNFSILYRDANKTKIWDNSLGDQVTLDNISGNVGIGTVSPSNTLSVANTTGYPILASSSNTDNSGIEIINTSSSRDWGIAVGGSGNPIAGGLAFSDRTAGAVRAVISTSGNVGISTAAAFTNAFEIFKSLR